MSHQKTLAQVVSAPCLFGTPETTVSVAAQRMRAAQQGVMVVCAEGQVLGLWSEQDALTLDFSQPSSFDLPLSAVMHSPVVLLPWQMTLSEAHAQFQLHRLHYGVVVNDAGEAYGIIAQDALLLSQGAEYCLQLKEVRSLALQVPLTVPAAMPLAEAVVLMRDHQADAVLVECEAGQWGVFTQRDVLQHLAFPGAVLTVGPLCHYPLLTVSSSANLYCTRQFMLDNSIQYAVVLNDEQACIGLFSLTDIVRGIEAEYVQQLQAVVSERDNARSQSQQNILLADRVFDAMLEGVMITNTDGIVEMINPAFSHITGWEKEDVIGLSPSFLRSGSHAKEFYRHMWASLHEHGSWQGEIINRRRDGNLYTENLTISSIRDEHGKITHFAGVFSDITQRKRSEERLHYLANHDPMTELPNRTLFMERLAADIETARRQKTKLATMFVDLDRFKFVNDTLGHAMGDRLLQVVAQRLTSSLRASDLVARLGGDEFTIVVNDISEARRVAHIAQKLVSSLAQPVELGGQNVYITCSIGISLYPDDGNDSVTLLKNADTAMYRAKTLGKNMFQFFTADMNEQMLRRLHLEGALRQALDRDEMHLFYQPKVTLEDGKVYGVEALLRWQHPEMGLVTPAEFMPVVEESSLIVVLGEWVLDTACKQARAWLEQGILPGTISVNLSQRQVRLPSVVETVKNALERYALPPEILELEISEVCAMDHSPEAMKTLLDLKRLGVRLAVDDFGVGYSNLLSLQQVPIDVIKINRSFVMDLHAERDDSSITSAMISMVRGLKLESIAVGIETNEQMEFLQQHGCFGGQGYWYSQPLSADDLASFLVQNLLPKK